MARHPRQTGRPAGGNHDRHDVYDVFELADRVCVMKNGQVVGTARTTDVTQDEVLGMIILGKCPPGAIPGPGALKIAA